MPATSVAALKHTSPLPVLTSSPLPLKYSRVHIVPVVQKPQHEHINE